MDPQLSVLMANQAQIKNGDIVLDPFVGTGSLLISASMFGGYTFGTDINFLMLHARTRPSRISQKVNSDFIVYKLYILYKLYLLLMLMN
jgi:tRNA (guanine10-N2)-methyltransferase